MIQIALGIILAVVILANFREIIAIIGGLLVLAFWIFVAVALYLWVFR